MLPPRGEGVDRLIDQTVRHAWILRQPGRHPLIA